MTSNINRADMSENSSQSEPDIEMELFKNAHAKVSAASPEMTDDTKEIFGQSEQSNFIGIVKKDDELSANQDGDRGSVAQEEEDESDESRHSWLLLANLFIFNAIQGFHFMSFGMYYVAWSDAFDTTKAAVGLINGLHYITRSVSSMIHSTWLLHFKKTE